MDKRAYYQDQRIVDNYDDWRFWIRGGAMSIRWRNSRLLNFSSEGRPHS